MKNTCVNNLLLSKPTVLAITSSHPSSFTTSTENPRNYKYPQNCLLFALYLKHVTNAKCNQ